MASSHRALSPRGCQGRTDADPCRGPRKEPPAREADLGLWPLGHHTTAVGFGAACCVVPAAAGNIYRRGKQTTQGELRNYEGKMSRAA